MSKCSPTSGLFRLNALTKKEKTSIINSIKSHIPFDLRGVAGTHCVRYVRHLNSLN